MSDDQQYIVDQPDKIAFKTDLGRDIAWDHLGYGEAPDEQQAAFNAAYEYVKWDGNNYFHTDGDLYQGSTLMRVIRRKSDGKLFGFAYWSGGGKHGEDNIDHNGDDHGFPSKYDWEDGVDEDEVWFVFRPIVSAPLPAYKFADEVHE